MTAQDRINARIAALDNLIKSNGKVIPFDAREGGILDSESSMADDEIEFLKELLVLLEKPQGWTGDVDRQGGSFTDAEINARLTGW